MSSSLKYDASTHDHSEDQHSPSTTQFLANEKSNDCSSETAEIVDRRDEALHGWRRVVEVLDEVLSHDDAPEHTYRG